MEKLIPIPKLSREYIGETCAISVMPLFRNHGSPLLPDNRKPFFIIGYHKKKVLIALNNSYFEFLVDKENILI